MSDELDALSQAPVIPDVIGLPEGPGRLYRAWRACDISRGSLRNTLPMAWSYDDHPMDHLEHDEWLELFRAAAPIRQPTNLPPLDYPLRLYRGSTYQRRMRMSWTTKRTVARHFVTRHRAYSEGALYTVTVNQDAVLAHLNLRRVEFEVVVDPAMLDEPERLPD